MNVLLYLLGRLSHTIKEYAYKIGQFEVTFAETKKAMSDPIMTKAWEITRKNITGTDFGLRGFKLTSYILDG